MMIDNDKDDEVDTLLYKLNVVVFYEWIPVR